jgi:hypothetical protein
MIVQIRIEVTDEQRRELTRRLRPNQMSKLATRKEVSAFLTARLAELEPKSQETEKSVPEPSIVESATVSRIEKHGTGIKRAVFHLNNAIFALNNAENVLRNDGHSHAASVPNFTADVLDLRNVLALEHDQEHANVA